MHENRNFWEYKKLDELRKNTCNIYYSLSGSLLHTICKPSFVVI